MKLKIEQATKEVVVLGFYADDDHHLVAVSFPPDHLEGVETGDEFRLVKKIKKTKPAVKTAKKK